MQYDVNYQYLPKGADRPIDAGSALHQHPAKAGEPFVLPNVGDYVTMNNEDAGGENFSGRVKSKLFLYHVLSSGKQSCGINIVVEEIDDDVWGQLIKE